MGVTRPCELSQCRFLACKRRALYGQHELVAAMSMTSSGAFRRRWYRSHRSRKEGDERVCGFTWPSKLLAARPLTLLFRRHYGYAVKTGKGALQSLCLKTPRRIW